MLRDITAVQVLGQHKLQLTFDDGVVGTVDLDSMLTFTGVFEPLKEDAEFRKAYVHPELKTVVWPCGADLDPDVLYAAVTGQGVSAATNGEH